MIIKGQVDPAQTGRTVYPLEGRELAVRHFVVRRTTPGNPFKPHRHEKEEIWFVVEGEGVLTRDQGETAVKAGDMVYIESNALHGLRTAGEIRWICMG